ncbi:MAG: LysR family transcriptional regulator [Methylophaga sp.]|nr:MAG: LysR family transcriptional regulator [Methylophaga sp.]
MKFKLKLNWQLSETEQQSVSPVLFTLLAAIKQHGSLKRATDIAGVSYRFAWGLLTKWQQLLGQPLVVLERGRGADLSHVGEQLLDANVQLLARFSPDLDNFVTQFNREFEAMLNKANSASLTIFASHGLAIAALRDLLDQPSSFKLDLHFHGSLESLRALDKGECDIAGFHIPAGPLAKTLAPQYLNILDPNKHQLIYVVKRNQGLMVQQGNPNNIQSIRSLMGSDIEFINRQNGSGTRLLFDLLLSAENITEKQINGYNNEEFTHMAVAAMIISGIADVGFGIAAMADKFKLEFIPLVWEHYCLAVPITLADDERVQQISSLLQDDDFKQNLSGFSGYDASRSGEQVTFTQIFS